MAAMCARYARTLNGWSTGNRSGAYPTRAGRSLTAPAPGLRSPAITRSSVDFPAPLCPVTSVTLPPGREKVTSLNTQGSFRR